MFVVLVLTHKLAFFKKKYRLPPSLVPLIFLQCTHNTQHKQTNTKVTSEFFLSVKKNKRRLAEKKMSLKKSEIAHTKIEIYADGLANVTYQVLPSKRHAIPLPITADIDSVEAYWTDTDGTLVDEVTVTPPPTPDSVSSALVGTSVKVTQSRRVATNKYTLLAKSGDAVVVSDPSNPTTCTVIGKKFSMEGTVPDHVSVCPNPVVGFASKTQTKPGVDNAGVADTGAAVTFTMSGIVWSLQHSFFLQSDEKVYVSRWIGIENQSETLFENARVELYRTRPRLGGYKHMPIFASMEMASSRSADSGVADSKTPIDENAVVAVFKGMNLERGSIKKKSLPVEIGKATVVHYAVVEDIPSSSEASRELRVSGLGRGIVAGERFVVRGPNNELCGVGVQHRTFGKNAKHAAVHMANAIGVTLSMTEKTSPNLSTPGTSTIRAVTIENHTPATITFELKTRDRAFGSDAIIFGLGNQSLEDGFHVVLLRIGANEKATVDVTYLFKPKEVVVVSPKRFVKEQIPLMSQ
jgi:hypothetical protein